MGSCRPRFLITGSQVRKEASLAPSEEQSVESRAVRDKGKEDAGAPMVSGGTWLTVNKKGIWWAK